MRSPSRALILGIALLAACSERVINISTEGSPADLTVRMTIGRQGGTLRVTDPRSPIAGTEVSVPPDAVAQNTEVTVSPVSGRDAPPPGGSRPIGPGVIITVSAELLLPATVTLPYVLDPGASERAALVLLAGSSWTPLSTAPASDGTRRLTAGTRRFGTLWAVSLQATEAADGGATDGAAPLDAAGGRGTELVPPTFAGLEDVALDETADGPRARLTWSEASDDVSAAGALRYRIYLPTFGNLGSPQGETSPGQLTALLPVSRGVTYYFLVRAVDEAGNEDGNLRVRSLEVPARPVDGGPDLVDSGADGTDAPVTRTLTIALEGQNSTGIDLVPAGSGQACTPTGCARAYAEGTQVTVTIEGNLLSQVRWSGPDASSCSALSCTLTMSTDRTLTGQLIGGRAAWIASTSNFPTEAIATDPAGNVYIVGSMLGATGIDFGDGAGVRNGPGGYDSYMASYTPAGAPRFVRVFGTSGAESFDAVTYDAVQDRMVVTSINGYGQTVDFGNGQLGTTRLSVILFDTAGVAQRVLPAGPAFNSNMLSVGVNPTGEIVWTTNHEPGQSYDFAGETFFGSGNGVLAGVFDAAGNPSWAIRISPTGTSGNEAVVSRFGSALILGNGDVVISGNYIGTSPFGTSAVAANFIALYRRDPSANGRAILVASDSWPEAFSPTEGAHLALAPGGSHILVSGSTSQQLQFGADSIAAGSPFLASFSTTLAREWAVATPETGGQAYVAGSAGSAGVPDLIMVGGPSAVLTFEGTFAGVAPFASRWTRTDLVSGPVHTHGDLLFATNNPNMQTIDGLTPPFLGTVVALSR